MSDHVYWILEVSIKDGQADAFKALMEEMVTATKADEPGALNYEWSLGDDGSSCHIYERYDSSDSTMVHLGNFGTKFAGRFMECAQPTKFTIYGAPDDTVKKALQPMGARYMADFGGFHRQ